MGDHLTEAVSQLAENMRLLCRQQAQKERVMMFLDNSNFYGSLGRISQETCNKFRVDYHKLYALLVNERFVINATCYYSDWEVSDEARLKRDNFRVMMEKAGFTLACLKQRVGATQEKGVDAAVVRDMVTAAHDVHRCDTFILISGDGDYADTVREVRKKYGVKVEVAFFACETAWSLRDACYKFIDLEPFREQIEMKIGQ